MTTDGLRRLRLGVAALGLVGLGAGTTTLLAPAPGAAVPAAAFPLEPLPAPDLNEIMDGLGHHVVFLGEDADAPSPDGGPTPDGSSGVQPDDSTLDGIPPAIGLDDLAMLGDRVDHLDGDGDAVLVAVLTDGRRVPVRTGPEQTPSSAPVAPTGLAGLEAEPTTRAVEPIGDGWYAVTTELDDDAFAELAGDLGLETLPDVPAIITSDDTNSDLLWGLDNPGGVSFGGVVGVADVDTDGVEARQAERGDGVIVAVIDSGAATDHPDLPEFWVNVDEVCDNGIDDDANGFVDDCEGWDFFNDDNTPFDPGVDNSHGTHVTGTIAAVPDNRVGVAGLAPGVTVMNIKALQNGSTWTSKLARAIYYAVDNGASVINASFGSTGTTMAQIPGLTAAVEHARSHGVIIVAAAGNSGVDIGTNPTYPASFPHDNVITVGADMANGQPASFSNRGDLEVDLHAPGHYIVSTVPGGYAAKQGTSMAAPHVTAAVALLQAADPGADTATVRAALLETVDRRASLLGTSVTGGSLNAARALGVDAPNEGAPFEVTVHGLDAIRADVPANLRVVSTVRDSVMAGNRPVVVRGTILTAIDGVDYGLVDLPVTVDGTSTVTDDHAQFILSEHENAYSNLLLSGHASTVRTTLEAGVYALVVEIVDAEDPDAAYGPAAVTFFEVPGAPDQTPDEPGDDPTDGPDGDDPNDGAPAPTLPDPDGAPEPGSGAPAPGPDAARPGSSEGDTPGTTTPTPSAPTLPGTSPSTPPTTAPGGATPTPDNPTSPTPGAPTPDGSTPVPGSPAPSAPPVGSQPPTTTPPVTVPGDPDPVTRAGMTLRKVSPTWGRLVGGNIVVIHGRNLPERPRVYLGGIPATLKRANDSSLIIEMPAALPGIYDVTVIDEIGFAVSLRLVYTYAPRKPQPGDPVSPGPTVPLPDLPGSDGPGAGDPAAGTPEPADPGPTGPATSNPTVPGPDSPGIDPTPDQPGQEPAAPPTTVPQLPTPTGRPRLQLQAQPAEHHDGRAHRVVVGSPIDIPPGAWPSRSCARPVCGAELHAWLPGA